MQRYFKNLLQDKDLIIILSRKFLKKCCHKSYHIIQGDERDPRNSIFLEYRGSTKMECVKTLSKGLDTRERSQLYVDIGIFQIEWRNIFQAYREEVFRQSGETYFRQIERKFSDRVAKHILGIQRGSFQDLCSTKMC